MRKISKILLITPIDPFLRNGVSNYVKKLVNYLDSEFLKFEILSFTNKVDKPFYLVKKNIKIYYYPLTKKNSLLYQFRCAIYTLKFLLRYGSRYDLYHIHTYANSSSLISIIISKFKKKKSILTFHGIRTIFHERYPFKAYADKFLRLIFGYIESHLAEKIVSVSKPDINKILFHFKPGKNKKIFYIQNGLVLESKKYNHKINNEEFITFIGELSYYKGFDFFLEIAKYLKRFKPNAKFLVVGKPSKDKELFQKLAQNKDDLDISYIKSIENIKKIFKNTVIYLLLSRSEGMSTTLLESMKYEVPIIATDINSNSYLIKDGYNGFLISTKDINKALKKIKLLLEDQNLRKNFINHSKKVLDKYFDWRIVIEKYKELYLNLLD